MAHATSDSCCVTAGAGVNAEAQVRVRVQVKGRFVLGLRYLVGELDGQGLVGGDDGDAVRLRGRVGRLALQRSREGGEKEEENEAATVIVGLGAA